MTKILIYDCEIINCIPTGEIDPNLNYCKGWGDFENMGISVIGTWRNFSTLNPFGKYEAFVNNFNWFPSYKDLFPNPFYKFQKIAQQADLVVGFNSLSFDDNLCQANGLKIKTDFDLLVEVRKASGQGDGHYQYGVTRKGYSLKDIAAANLSYNKSASGDLAPVMWQKGQRKEVIDYCLRDVKILKELYFKFINNKLIDPQFACYPKIIPGNKALWELRKHYSEHLKWVKDAYSEQLNLVDIPF